MAKVVSAEAQSYADKQVAAALKAERKRVAEGVKGIALPEEVTARVAAGIKRSVKEAVAAPAA